MNVRLVALISVVLASVAACASDSTQSSLPPLVGLATDSSSTTAVPAGSTSLVASASTTLVPATIAPSITTVAPTTAPPTPAPPPDPHGPAIETGCVRSNIDFAAVRVAPGVAQPEVGEIPPATCNVLVYATGSDGRIAWLEVGIGDIFGWSAQSNFVQSSLVAVAAARPAAAATTLPQQVGSSGAPLDLQAQTVFGFHVGNVSTDQMISNVSARLGPPTFDTGWVAPSPPSTDDDCSIGVPSRTTRWGDLTLAWWQQTQSDFLWSWSVGNPGVTAQADPNGPNNLLQPATGLRDATGIGVGSTIESVNAAFGQQFHFTIPGAGQQFAFGTPDAVSGAAASMLAQGDVVTGIGSSLQFC